MAEIDITQAEADALIEMGNAAWMINSGFSRLREIGSVLR